MAALTVALFLAVGCSRSHARTRSAPPSITGFTPAGGASVGASVTLEGTNLAGVGSLSFHGAVQKTFRVNAEGTQIVTTVPPGATTGPIVVASPGGAAGSSTFHVLPGVGVTSFTSAAARVEIGASVDLAWTTSGTPTSLVLEPGHLDVTGRVTTTTTAFPIPTPGVASARCWKLVATDPNVTGEVAALSWASPTAGGTTQASAVAAFPDGSSIATGWFRGTATFAPGRATPTTLSSAGGDDVFVARSKPDGTLAWAVSCGGAGTDRGRAVAAFGDGSAVVAGSFQGTVTFGSGAASVTLGPSAGTDAFVARFRPDGSLAWAVASTDLNGAGLGVAACRDGTTLVTGTFRGTATLGAGAAAVTLTAVGSDDVFLARYGPTGTLVSAWAAGGTGSDAGSSVAACSDGSAIVTGSFEGAATFGAGAKAVTLSAAGGSDAFVARYGPDGSLSWAKSAGGTGADRGSGVAAFPDGTAVVVGSFSGTASFGPYASTAAPWLAAAGLSDGFVARFLPDGSLDWVQSIGGAEDDLAIGAAALPDGSALVTGAFRARARCGGGAAVLTSAGGADLFLVVYEADGRVALAKSAGGASDDRGAGVAALPGGGAVVAAGFGGTATFGQDDPDPVTLATTGEDLCLARYSPVNYALVTVEPRGIGWAVALGGTGGDDVARAVSVLPDGSSLVSGFYRGQCTFGSGAKAITLTKVGGYDFFLARYAPDGSPVWAVSAGGPSTDVGNAMTAFPDGSSIVTGAFKVNCTFGTGSSVTTLFTAGTQGKYDAFVARYQPDGTLAWATRIGGPLDDYGLTVGACPDGGCIVTGYMFDTVTFGTGASAVTLTSAGGYDIFLVRFAADGSIRWARSAGGTGDDYTSGVAVFEDGSSVVTGQFAGTATFGTGAAATTLTAVGGYDVFVARYDAQGNLVWAKSAGGTGEDIGNVAATYPDGSACIVGNYTGTATFGSGPAVVTLTASGGADVFVARYAADGTLLWVTSAGGPALDQGNFVAAGPDGNAVITGGFQGSATFGTGASAVTLTSAGADDVFVASYDASGKLAWAKSAGGATRDVGWCVGVLPDGGVIASGLFNGTATFGAGEPGATNLAVAPGNNGFVVRYFPY